MSRLVHALLACSCLLLTITSVGCGSDDNTVIEQSGDQAEVQAEFDEEKDEEARAEKSAASKGDG